MPTPHPSLSPEECTAMQYDLDEDGHWLDTNLSSTEDEATFGPSQFTCASCRRERLNGQIERNSGNLPQWTLQDHVVRRLIEDYVDFGERELRTVYSDIEERIWLATNTRYDALYSEAAATVRAEAIEYRRRFGGTPNSDDSTLSHQSTETIRSIAVNDWARTRILAGCWISPWDTIHNSYSNQINQIMHGFQMGYTPQRPIHGNMHSVDPQILLDCLKTRIVGGKFQDFTQRLYGMALRSIIMPALQNILKK